MDELNVHARAHTHRHLVQVSNMLNACTIEDELNWTPEGLRTHHNPTRRAQMFNMLNARKIEDELNVMAGIFNSHVFWTIWVSCREGWGMGGWVGGDVWVGG